MICILILQLIKINYLRKKFKSEKYFLRIKAECRPIFITLHFLFK